MGERHRVDRRGRGCIREALAGDPAVWLLGFAGGQAELDALAAAGATAMLSQIADRLRGIADPCRLERARVSSSASAAPHQPFT